ncbi:PocR ligand-binding domain-containing protein [Clostridium sp. OS1-26]|uniref:sensor histidine kinase n=1 Tax=Clostridium sp. OS1-26 TaxID=3070681 RepID=UPI0027E019BE|nr:PocR ligand-binding domain-containing protein [Clostridium sp. OS1-26]WML34416.1 PocR ligand-binding domain-containing protein [Clostridium sp. OS1-26]
MNINLRDIVTEEFQQEVQDSFAYATGFGVVFTDREGKHIGLGSNFTRFCSAINQDKEGSKCCQLSNQQAIAIALKTNQPCIYVCHAGLINIEIPLIHDDYYIGAITAAQVLCSDMDYYPRDTICSSKKWLDYPEYAEYFSEIKVLSKAQIEATTVALSNLSNYILQKAAYTKMQQELFDKMQKLLIYEKKQIELEHQLMLAKFSALQKQVSPHFIFNMLNSISRLIYMQEYDTAEKMLSSFTKMMRYSLYNNQSSVTLLQELNYIKSYLLIQKIRFNERISYEIICDPEIEHIHIPFFSLQPLVENSIEHGILNVPSGGRILVHCQNTSDNFYIYIYDNGIGIKDDKLQDIINNSLSTSTKQQINHVGLYNCYNRLKLMYNEAVTFNIASKPDKGTEITICIAKGNL